MTQQPTPPTGGRESSNPPDFPADFPLSGTVARALGWWVGHVHRMAWFVIAAILLVTALLGVYTATHLGMQTDTSAMLSSRLDWRRDSDRLDSAFPNLVRNIVIVVDAANPDIARDGAAALARRLAARSDIFETVHYPAGDSFFRKHGLLFMDVEALDRLSARLADAQPLLGRLARDPSLRGFFDMLSTAAEEIAKGEGDPETLAPIFARVADTVRDVRSGRMHGLSWVELIEGKSLSSGEARRIILVKPKPDYGALSPAKQAIALIRTLGADPEIGGRYPIKIRLTGTLPLQHEEMASVQRSAGLAGVISMILVGVVIFAGLRSGRLVFATLAILVVGLIWTAAFATAAIGHLNIISVAFAVLFLGISVDFGIQICLRYREAVDEGMPNDSALRAACAGVGPAVGLSALTSAIGFFAFVPTDYVGMAELGIIAGSGIFIALFLYLTLLPAILAITPLTPRGGAASPAGGLVRMEGWLARHRKTVALGCLAAVLAAMAALPHLRFEFDPIKLKDPRAESVKTYLDLAGYADTSPYTIDVLASDAAAAEDMATRLRTLPEVARVVTLGSFTPDRQPEKLEIIEGMNLFLAPVYRGTAVRPRPKPEDRKAALLRLRDRLRVLPAPLKAGAASPKAGAASAPAKRLADLLDRYAQGTGEAGYRPLETALVGTLPGRLAALKDSLSARRVNVRSLPENLLRRHVGRGGEARITIHPTADLTDPAALRKFVNAVHGIAPNATETPVLILRAGDAVVTAFLRAGAIATLCIIVALLVILRNLADALMVLAPVLVAALLCLAATVVLNIPFNFANVIALPLLLALGVDFGIHLVLRHREAGSVEALLRTSTPRAVFYSGLTTMCSFGSLAVSGHLGTASMGYLLLISLTFGLLSALVALPALLSWREFRATRENLM